MKSSIKKILVLCLMWSFGFLNLSTASTIGNNKTLFVESFGYNIFSVDEDNNSVYEREDALISYALSHGYQNLMLYKLSHYPTIFSKSSIITSSTSLDNRFGDFIHKAHLRGIQKIGVASGPDNGLNQPSLLFDNVNEFNKRMLILHPSDGSYCFDIIYTESDWWYVGNPGSDVDINYFDYYLPGISRMYQVVKPASVLAGHELIVATYLGNLTTLSTITATGLANTIDQYTDWIFIDFYFNGNSIPNTSPIRFFKRDFDNGERFRLFSQNQDPTTILPLFSSETSSDPNFNFFGDNLNYDNGNFYNSNQLAWHGTTQDVKDRFNDFYENSIYPYYGTSNTLEEITEGNLNYTANVMTAGVGWFKYGNMPDSKYWMSMPADNLNISACQYTLSFDEIVTNFLHNTGNGYTYPNTFNNQLGSPDALLDSYHWYKNGVLQSSTSANLQISLINNVVENWTCEIKVNGNNFFPNYKFRDDIVVGGTPITVSISTPSLSVCSGDIATFTANANGGVGYSYQWRRNGVNISGATSSVYSTNAISNNDIFDVKVIAQGICSNQVTVYSNQIVMTTGVTLLPSVTINANPGNTFCTGSTINFNSIFLNGGATPVFSWQINGNTVPGATNSTFQSSSLSANDIITCILSSSLSCASSNPVTSNQITMSLNSPVIPSISISTMPAGSICAGTNVVFTATELNGGSQPSFQWKKNGISIPWATNATYQTSNLVNNDVITCEMTSSDLCAVPVLAISNAIPMSVQFAVPNSVSITSNLGNTICQASTVSFTATGINGGGAPAYQWVLNGNIIPGETTTTYSTSSLAINDVVTCRMISSLSCASPIIATSNQLIDYPSLTPTVSISSSIGNPVCAGTPVTFTASPTYGGLIPSYQWKKNSISIAGATAVTYSSIGLNAGDIITCVMSSQLPCATVASVTSNSIPVNSTSSASVSINISSGSNPECNGASITFLTTPVNGGLNPIYQWTKNGSLISGATASSYQTTNLTDGDQIGCSMISDNSCASNINATAIPILMQVNNVGVTTTAFGPTCSYLSDGHILANASGGSPSYTYSFDGGAFGSATSPSSYPGGTVHSVVAKDNIGCTSPLLNSTIPNTQPISISVTAARATCNDGNSTGNISIQASGGTPSYTYSINNGSSYTSVLAPDYSDSFL